MSKLKVSVVAITALIAGFLTATPAIAATPSCTITESQSGTPGAQRVVTGTGNGDVICLNGNYLTVEALGGNDTVVDNGDHNIIYLGDGSDNYNGTSGDDATVEGGNGIDNITGTPTGDELDGGSGDDTIISGSGNDLVNGGAGNDVLEGRAGNDIIYGEAGNDDIYGGDGIDSIEGGEGEDSLIGGAADDSLRGGEGDDSLEGSAGNDDIFGEVGEDRLAGNEGNDIIAGGDGVDILEGGFGLNTCDYTNMEVKHKETCVYDDKAPEITGFRWDSFSYDSTTADSRAISTFDITDDVESLRLRLSCYGNDRNLVYYSLVWTGTTWVIEGYNVNNPRVLSVTKVPNSTLALKRQARISVETTIPRDTTPGSYYCGMQATDSLEHTAGISVTSLTVTRITDTGSGVIIDDSAPMVKYFAWDKSSYNVTTADAEVNFDINLTDESGVREFQVACYGPNNNPLRVNAYYNATNNTWQANGARSVSVTAQPDSNRNFAPKLQFTTSIRYGNRPGVNVCHVWAIDVKGISKYTLVKELHVVRDLREGGWDDDAPKVVSSSWSPASMDIGAQSLPAEITLNVTDRTGIDYFVVSCYGSTGMNPVRSQVVKTPSGWSVSGAHSDTITSVTGSATDVTLTIRTLVPFGTVPGPQVCGVSTYDVLGHNGWTPAETLQLLRTPPGMPNEPTNLSYTPVPGRPNEGTLDWDAPSFLGEPVKEIVNGVEVIKTMPDGRVVGELADYEIEYSLDGGESWKRIDDGYSTTTNLPVSNLIAGTRYLFRIRANNGGNDIDYSPGAPWSTVLDITTPEPMVPNPVTNLEISNITKNSAVMKWAAPDFNGGSPIKNFVVETSLNEGPWRPVNKAEATSVNLSLKGLAPGSSYRFRVAAVNKAGQSEYTESVGTYLTLQGQATKPLNVAASENTGTSMLLTWDIPESNGGSSIRDYQIEVSSNAGVTWTKIRRVDVSNLRNFRLNNLVKGKSYRFRVSAVTDLGVGTPSDVLSVTMQVTAPSAPTNLVTSAITGTTATITWSLPADSGGASIEDYLIELSNDNGDTWIENVDLVDSVARSWKFSGLTPGDTYLVQVTAINAAGYSDTLSGSFTTNRLVPTAPTELAGSVGSTTAELTWVTPESNGGAAITDYKVEVSSNCKTYTAIAHQATNVTGFSVSALKPGTKYCFRVSAKNSVGFSPASEVITLVTDGNAPDAPTSLAIKPAATSVLLSWTQSAVIDGSAVRNYVVEYSKDNGATWLAVAKRVSTAKSLTISGLKRNTTYQFRVTSVNDVGESPVSEVLTAITKR